MKMHVIYEFDICFCMIYNEAKGKRQKQISGDSRMPCRKRSTEARNACIRIKLIFIRFTILRMQKRKESAEVRRGFLRRMLLTMSAADNIPEQMENIVSKERTEKG